jgi:Ig-like domain from next to BRCA1 gene
MPDGTSVNAGEKFSKTWRFKNIGTCPWTTSFKFIFIDGDKMDASDSISLPNDVAPNETVDITADFTAPATPGTYKGIWSFEDDTGRGFGLGSSANGQIWVQVKVILAPTSTSTPTAEATQTSLPASEETIQATNVVPLTASSKQARAYDFVSEICSAQWLSNNVQQPCPGPDGDTQNAVHLVTLPALEDGTTLNDPAILISPNNSTGSVQAIYPEFLVESGDHFRAIASCEADATECSALFRVSYQDASNAIVDLWAVGEFYDQKYTQIDIDLSALAGQKVKFILDVTPLNTNPGNHVFWASPGIYREPTPTVTATAPPTATATNTNTPTPTTTLLPPTPTSTPIPQGPVTLSTFEKIQKFFSDIFKNIFGG